MTDTTTRAVTGRAPPHATTHRIRPSHRQSQGRSLSRQHIPPPPAPIPSRAILPPPQSPSPPPPPTPPKNAHVATRVPVKQEDLGNPRVLQVPTVDQHVVPHRVDGRPRPQHAVRGDPILRLGRAEEGVGEAPRRLGAEEDGLPWRGGVVHGASKAGAGGARAVERRGTKDLRREVAKKLDRQHRPAPRGPVGPAVARARVEARARPPALVPPQRGREGRRESRRHKRPG